jgi:hypothetical protein
MKIYQIETTNHCNADCEYCLHSKLARPKGFITELTFRLALGMAENRELELHHFGEPLLHRNIVELVGMATDAGKLVGLSTNGLLLTQALLDALLIERIQWIRLHTDPYGVRLENFEFPSWFEFTEHSLTGSTEAPSKEKKTMTETGIRGAGPGADKCSFIVDDWRVILWDGTVGLCCMDYMGVNDTRICEGCCGYEFKSPRDFYDLSDSGYGKTF